MKWYNHWNATWL